MADDRTSPIEFEGWYRDAWPSLVRALAAWSGRPGDAAEAASEACARAFAQWDRVQAMASPTGWAFSVGQSHLRRGFRLGRRHATARSVPSAPGPLDELAGVADRDEVLRLLQELPPRQREAVVLRYLLDLTQEQVATQMSLAPGTVAATLHAARVNLRRSRPKEETRHGD